MKELLIVLAIASSTTSAMGQGFWAPGACWTYDNGAANGERYQYTNDTIVNGMNLQVCTYVTCWIDGLGGYHCGGINEPFHDYVTVLGDAVLFGLNSPTGLDTMFWMGVPGDRWWAPGSEAFCLGYSGMIEIQDTGHVVIDGVSLRTWDVARLEADGTPSTWFTETITERIGTAPRRFCPTICSVMTECETFSVGHLVHYSDNDINIPIGVTCSMAMSDGPSRSLSAIQMTPNPGTDQLTITGIAPASKLEVRDAFGRLVLSQNATASNATLGTSEWPSGTYSIAVIDSIGHHAFKWIKQ